MPFKNSLKIDEIFANDTKGTAINTSNISKIMNGIKWYVQFENQIKNYVLPWKVENITYHVLPLHSFLLEK